MKQKFITIAGIRLAYLEHQEEKKSVIFFIHGNSLSSRSWNAQLNSELFKDYRLIAIDLPAHGDSEGSDNPEADYSIPGMAAIIGSAVKALAGNSPYLLAALSLGTNILAEALAFDLQPKGLVLASSCLVGGKYTLDSFAYPDTHVHVVFTGEAPENEVRIYASQVMASRYDKDIEEFVTDYYKVKPAFRSNLINSIQQQRFNDEIALVARTGKPLLVIFGKDEQIVNPDYLDDAPLNLWKGNIYKLPGASHLINLDQPEVFNRLLADYAADIFNAAE